MPRLSALMMFVGRMFPTRNYSVRSSTARDGRSIGGDPDQCFLAIRCVVLVSMLIDGWDIEPAQGLRTPSAATARKNAARKGCDGRALPALPVAGSSISHGQNAQCCAPGLSAYMIAKTKRGPPSAALKASFNRGKVITEFSRTAMGAMKFANSCRPDQTRCSPG
jgi:hypothetical protein